MTKTERSKIETIVKYCKEGNPQKINTIVNSLLCGKISEIIDRKREEIKKEL